MSVIAEIRVYLDQGEIPKLKKFKITKSKLPCTPFELRALVALLGGYNGQARNVDVEVFEKEKCKFDELVSHVADLIKGADAKAGASC